MQLEQAGKYIIDKMTRELPGHFSYHNAAHVMDVYDAARLLAQQEGISDYETQLLLTAAYFHDAGFIEGADNHEEGSCLIAHKALPGFGYGTAEIKLICGMIRATRLPQTPKTHVEQILADADLDYLGRDDFCIIGDKLYQELVYLGKIGTREEWNRLQVQFLENHRYFTPAAVASRADKKQQNLQQLLILQQATGK